MNVIGYIRVSTDEQVEGYGLGVQRSAIEQYCLSLGHNLIDVMADEGCSGSSLDRPSLTRIIDIACAQGNTSQSSLSSSTHTSPQRIDAIIVHKLDRLSRQLKDILNLHDDIFVRNGISFISIKEQFDTASPMGKFIFQLIGGFGEFERKIIRDRMYSGRQHKASLGKFAGGSAPYGYDVVNGNLVVVEREAAIVRQVYELRHGGLSLKDISDSLNTAETPTKRGGTWTKSHIKAMLDREPFYRGIYKHGDTEAKGVHNPILPTEGM